MTKRKSEVGCCMKLKEYAAKLAKLAEKYPDIEVVHEEEMYYSPAYLGLSLGNYDNGLFTHKPLCEDEGLEINAVSLN